MKSVVSSLVLLCCAAAWSAPLPPRPADAPGGQEFAARLLKLPLTAREAAVRDQFLAGNVPESWRKFVELKVSRKIGEREHTAVLRVAPDYLAIGSDEDALLMPLTPATAMDLAASLNCSIPTRRLVDEIHRAAPAKLIPAPLPAGPEMTTVLRFAEHNEAVRKQRLAFPAGMLTAGHKKDIVLTPRVASAPGKVAIYGWHHPDGTAIQPLYAGHSSTWVDYSHGVRLVENTLTINGTPSTIAAVLSDPALAALLSDEGPFHPAGAGAPVWPAERVVRLNLDAGVEAVVNVPARRNPARPLRLVIYAAPAGNTAEQTYGGAIAPGGDPKYELQHILAQTRWLRMHDPSADLAVAVVQCGEKSWPAWRRARDPGNRLIPGIVAAVRDSLQAPSLELTLSGHSAGGSFVFGCLDAVDSIAPDISRLCFLDSNYAYSSDKGHHRSPHGFAVTIAGACVSSPITTARRCSTESHSSRRTVARGAGVRRCCGNCRFRLPHRLQRDCSGMSLWTCRCSFC
jgi:hypothetical protein